RADGLSQQDLRQPRHHSVGSQAVGIKLLKNFRNGSLKPGRGRSQLEMKERWENGQQRIGRAVGKSQAATQQSCDGSVATKAKHLRRAGAVARDEVGGSRR